MSTGEINVTVGTSRPPIVLDLHPPTAIDDVVTLIHALAAAFPHSTAQMVSNQPNGAYRIEITHKPDDDPPPDDAQPAHVPAPPGAPPRVTACDPPRMAVMVDGTEQPIEPATIEQRTFVYGPVDGPDNINVAPLARVRVSPHASAIFPSDIDEIERAR